MTPLLLVLAAQILSATPPLSPDAAVAVLQASHSDRDRTHAAPSIESYPGPRAVVMGTGQATLGPWTFPRREPARRLDGTRLSDPPAVYGLPAYYGPYGGYGRRDRAPVRQGPRGRR